MVARYWIEGLAGIPCNVEIASEYRYRESVPNPKGLVVTCRSRAKRPIPSRRCNTRSPWAPLFALDLQRAGIALVRASDLRFLTRAGPEIGVASTKAFTTQLAVLVLLTMTLARSAASSRLSARARCCSRCGTCRGRSKACCIWSRS